MGQGVIEISVLHEAGVLFLSEFRHDSERSPALTDAPSLSQNGAKRPPDSGLEPWAHAKARSSPSSASGSKTA